MDFGNRPPPNLGKGVTGKAGWDSNQVPILDVAGLMRDDVAIPNASGVLVPRQMSSRRLSVAAESQSTVYASVPELAVTINRVGPIVFSYYLIYGTSAVGEGIGVRLAFSGTANGVWYTIDGFTAPATRAALLNALSFGSAVAPYPSGPGAIAANACSIRIHGGANITAVGELNLQIRNTSGAGQIAGLNPSSFAQVSACD